MARNPWQLCFCAQLENAKHTHSIVKPLLDFSRTCPNMFDAHPPFQIDGNFGGTSGICEMLLQSHVRESGISNLKFEIELLPALPKAWPPGSVKGLQARGNVTVNLVWKDGNFTHYRLTSPDARPVRARINSELETVRATPDGK